MVKNKVNLQRIPIDKTRISTYKKRKACLYKKADEFSTLCGVETCLIVYGPTKATDEMVSEPEIWPRDETKVRNIIRKYADTVSNSCRKETHVETFVNDIGKAKEMETNKRVKRNNNIKYCNWEDKLDKCSQEQLLGILGAVENKLHEARLKLERSMIRVHHQATETIPQSLMDQHYNMQQYLPDQQQQQRFQGLMFPSYDNMGLSYMSSPNDHIQMENFTDLGLSQGLMMSKGNDGTQWMQRTGLSYYNPEPVVQRNAAFNGNQFVGYQSSFNVPWRFPGPQVDEWGLVEKKPNEGAA